VHRRIQVSGNLLGEEGSTNSFVNADVSEKPWRKLLNSEQLRQALASGHVFPGFAEPPITFPPSYRIRKSQLPVLLRRRHDFCNLDKVKDGYSVSDPSDAQSPSASGQEPEKSELSKGDVDTEPLLSNHVGVKKVRTPSYTDRILMRMPVLAGVPVSAEDYRRELKARKDRRTSKARQSMAPPAVTPATGTTEESGQLARAHFVPLPALRCLMYDALDALVGSDHLPVVSVWELPLSLPDCESPSAESPSTTVDSRTPHKVKARAVPVHTRAVPEDVVSEDVGFPTYLPFPLVMPSALEVLGHLPPASVSSALTLSSSIAAGRQPASTTSDASPVDSRIAATSRSLGRVARFSDAESDGGEDELPLGHIPASNTASPASSASSYPSQVDAPTPPPPMVNTGGRIAATLRVAKMLPGDSLSTIDMHTRVALEAARQQMQALARASSYQVAHHAPAVFDSSPDMPQEVFYFQTDREQPLMVPPPQFLFPAPPPTCRPPPPYTWPMGMLQEAGVNLLDLPLDVTADDMPSTSAIPPPPPAKRSFPPKPPTRPSAMLHAVDIATGLDKTPATIGSVEGRASLARMNDSAISPQLPADAAPGSIEAMRAVPPLLVRQRTQEWNTRAMQLDESKPRFS
jgi:hypothetical protein